MIDFFSEPSDFIRILNKRKSYDVFEDEVIIDVDRSNPVLGNPFVLKNKDDMQERLSVISKFKEIIDSGYCDEEIDKICLLVSSKQKVALRCWCHPLPCHADLIKQRIIERSSKISEIT